MKVCGKPLKSEGAHRILREPLEVYETHGSLWKLMGICGNWQSFRVDSQDWLIIDDRTSRERGTCAHPDSGALKEASWLAWQEEVFA